MVLDIFRTFYPKAAEYTFFSSAFGKFSRVDHMFGHKNSFKFKIEILSSIYSNHDGMKLKSVTVRNMTKQTHGGEIMC